MNYDFEHLNERTLGRGLVVAIDGPSGSGKSTISRRTAAALDVLYLDTGAMYRALAWYVKQQVIDPTDAEVVEEAAQDFPLKMRTLAHMPAVMVGNRDITNLIRTAEISRIASTISAYPKVRERLHDLQRHLVDTAQASGRGMVLEGRDTTTVIAPDADVRILLTASEEVRLRRRAREHHGAATEKSIADTHEEVVARDRRDAETTSFLEPAPGVTLIDTTWLTIDEVCDRVLAEVEDIL